MDKLTFIALEQMSRDTIDVKRVYIDMAGDLISGVLLSQIIYWHLPDQYGQSKLVVEKNGHLWLAKRREDWWDECRISTKQFDRSCLVLEDRLMVKSELFKYDGVPVKHIRLNWDVFLEVYQAMVSYGVVSVSWEGGKWILPKGENGLYRKGKMDFTERGKSEIAGIPDFTGTDDKICSARLHTENTYIDKKISDFFGKNQTPENQGIEHSKKSSDSPNRLIGVNARKRLKGDSLEIFELIADNLKKCKVTELERWCKNNPEKARAAYNKTVEKGVDHYNYFATVFDNLPKTTKPLSAQTTFIDYDNVDPEIYSGANE